MRNLYVMPVTAKYFKVLVKLAILMIISNGTTGNEVADYYCYHWRRF